MSGVWLNDQLTGVYVGNIKHQCRFWEGFAQYLNKPIDVVNARVEMLIYLECVLT